MNSMNDDEREHHELQSISSLLSENDYFDSVTVTDGNKPEIHIVSKDQQLFVVDVEYDDKNKYANVTLCVAHPSEELLTWGFSFTTAKNCYTELIDIIDSL